MKNFDETTHEALRSDGLNAQILVWIVAHANPSQFASLGLWTGGDTRQFTIDGASRTYYGAGAVLELPPLRAETGLDVRETSFTLSNIDAHTADLVRGYNLRFGTLTLHRALFDPDTDAQLVFPHRLFDGIIETVDIRTPPAGGVGAITIKAVSMTRRLTRTLALRMSDEDGQKTQNDRIFRHSALSGQANVWWGQKREGSS